MSLRRTSPMSFSSSALIQGPLAPMCSLVPPLFRHTRESAPLGETMDPNRGAVQHRTWRRQAALAAPGTAALPGRGGHPRRPSPPRSTAHPRGLGRRSVSRAFAVQQCR